MKWFFRVALLLLFIGANVKVMPVFGQTKKLSEIVKASIDSTCVLYGIKDSSGYKVSRGLKLPTGAGYVYSYANGVLVDTSVPNLDTSGLHNQIVLRAKYSDSGTVYYSKFGVDSAKSSIRASKVNYTDSGTVYYSKFGVDSAKSSIRASKVNYTDSSGGFLPTKAGTNTWTGVNTYRPVLTASSGTVYGTYFNDSLNVSSTAAAEIVRIEFNGANSGTGVVKGIAFYKRGTLVAYKDSSGRDYSAGYSALTGGYVLTNGNSIATSTGALSQVFSHAGGAIIANTYSSTACRAASIEKNATDATMCILRLVKSNVVVDSFPVDGSMWSAANGTFAGRVIAGTSTDDGSNALQVTGNLKLESAGNKINIATGTNASVGSGTLSSGAVTISTTAVTASSKIFIQYTSCSNCGSTYISAKVAGTSFTVTSSNVLDGSTFDYWIIN